MAETDRPKVMKHDWRLYFLCISLSLLETYNFASLIHGSLSFVQRPPFIVHRSPFPVPRSPFPVHRSPFSVHHFFKSFLNNCSDKIFQKKYF